MARSLMTDKFDLNEFWEIHVEDGDFVNTGAVLASLDGAQITAPCEGEVDVSYNPDLGFRTIIKFTNENYR